jgi:hypothetical protein
MSMTRTHFQALADAVADIEITCEMGGNGLNSFQARKLRISIAEVCGNHNPNFDHNRFSQWIEKRKEQSLVFTQGA